MLSGFFGRMIRHARRSITLRATEWLHAERKWFRIYKNGHPIDAVYVDTAVEASNLAEDRNPVKHSDFLEVLVARTKTDAILARQDRRIRDGQLDEIRELLVRPVREKPNVPRKIA